MYVCICNRVTHATLIKVVKENGELSIDQLLDLLGIAKVCGKCLSEARHTIFETLENGD